MTWLLAQLLGLRSIASRALGWLTGSPTRLLSALLALSLLLGWTLLERGNRYRDKLASTLAAQSEATAAQVAVNHAPAAISAAIAEKSDAQSADYYARGRRDGAAYAAAHRLHGPCAPSPADLPGADHPSPLDDRPGVAPGMVVVSRTDFDTLTGNSLRLAQVHADAEALIAAGVAVPVGDGVEGR